MACSSSPFVRADVTKRIQEAYLAQHEADERGDLQEGWRPVKTDDGRTYYWNESTDAVTWEKPTRPSRYGGMGEPCAVCNKTVYLAERRSAGGVAYHAECFRCSACKKKLEASSWRLSESGVLYCAPHFEQNRLTGTDKGSAGHSRSNSLGGDTPIASALASASASSSANSSVVGITSPEPAAAVKGGKEAGGSTHPGGSSAPMARRFGGGGERCAKCARAVYAAERVSVAGRILHSECFRCAHCNKRLDLSGWVLDKGPGELLCQVHHGQRIKASGMRIS